MSRKRKKSLKTKPPGLSALVRRPDPWPRVVQHQGGTLTYHKSADRYAADPRHLEEGFEPQLGFPSHHLHEPGVLFGPNGDLGIEEVLARAAFILSMYSEAEEYIHQLHTNVFPRLQAIPERLRENPIWWDDFNQLNWHGGQFHVTWEELERGLPALDELRQAFMDWLDGRDLWNSWFIGFCLDLFSSRMSGDLVGVPSVEDMYYYIVAYADRRIRFNLGLGTMSWDTLVVPEGKIEQVSLFTFDDIKRSVLDAVAAYLEEWRPQYERLRELREEQAGINLRSLDNYRWLVRRIWHRETYSTIADLEAHRIAVLRESSPQENWGELKVPIEETIRDGCARAAAKLGIDPNRNSSRSTARRHPN